MSDSRQTTPSLGSRSATSIRRALLLSLLPATLLVMLVAGISLGLMVRKQLTDQLDEKLLTRAQALASLVFLEEDWKYEVEFADEIMTMYDRGQHPDYFQLWRPNGTVLERSRSLDKRDLPAIPRTESRWWADMALPDGRSGRVVWMKFAGQLEEEEQAGDPRARQMCTVAVAVERESLDALIQKIGLIIFGAFASIAALLCVLLITGISRGLLPLQELTRTVEQVDASNLRTRIPPEDYPVELKPVCQRMNEMFERLEKSFERERRFNSNVSHELRTPLAETMTAIEMALRWPEEPNTVRSSCESALESTGHMKSLLSTLLSLSRAENGQISIELDDIDLDTMLRDIVAVHSELARERGVAIHLHDADLLVESNTPLLRSILSNLIANAVSHSPERADVEIEVKDRRDGAAVVISNPTEDDLTDADAENMFDAFWRKDASRTDQRHLGLGLSIAREFAWLIGATLRARVQHQRVEIILELPASTVHRGKLSAVPSDSD